jgi:glycerophosphoryl diester phosphodiesterase
MKVLKLLGVVTAALVTTVGLATPAQPATGCPAAREQFGGRCGAVAFAHRGAYGSNVDENTDEAVEAAYAKHAYMETDVWLTQDHNFVIMHDRSLNRTTNCEGDVADWLLADIQANCQTEPNGSRIPDFNEFADLLADNPGQLMMVEIKGPGWYDDDNDPLKRLGEAASQAGVLDRVYFANDVGTGYIEALRDVAPTAQTVWKQEGDESVTRKRARELSVDAVAIRPRQWTSAGKVAAFQSKGFLAWSLMANDKPAWKGLIRRGVTGVLTDKPGAFRKVCAQVGS